MLQSWQQSSALKAAKEAEKQKVSLQKNKETRIFFDLQIGFGDSNQILSNGIFFIISLGGVISYSTCRTSRLFKRYPHSWY